MSITFTKLFSSITESTVWCEPDRTRLVWITMLAMADRMGRVWASVPGLANRARVPVEDARIAVATFLAPDPDSRSPEEEGRRIREIDGGWQLINHAKYLAKRDEEDRKAYKREWIKEYRRKKTKKSTVDRSRPQHPHADADADADIVNTIPHTSGEAPSYAVEKGQPPRVRRKKPSPDPHVKAVIDHYYQTYLARFKSPPPIAGGKCGAIAKRLLAGRSLEDAKWLITAHLDRAPEMYERKNLYRLEHVLHAAPVLLARRAKDRGDYE